MTAPKIISSETATIVSLVCQRMPDLHKSILQFSTPPKKKSISSPIPVLSSQQIQEALLHPSTIVKQALRTVAIIQTALNAYTAKLDALVQQRHAVEVEYSKLSASVQDDPAIPNNKSAIDSLNELKKLLAMGRKLEKEVEPFAEGLKKEFDSIDKIIPQHLEEWLKHREQYFTELATQFETNGITLTTEEKAALRNASNTISIIQENLAILEKFKLTLPSAASDFAIAAHIACISALSRNLQKIDNKAVKNIIKELSVIGDELKASGSVRSDYHKQYDKIIESVKQLDAQIDKVSELSHEQLRQLEQIKRQIASISRPVAVQPEASPE